MPDRFPRASGGDYARSSLRGSFMPPLRQSGLPLRQSGLRQSGMQLRQSGLPGRQGTPHFIAQEALACTKQQHTAEDSCGVVPLPPALPRIQQLCSREHLQQCCPTTES